MPFWPFLAAVGLDVQAPDVAARRSVYAHCTGGAILAKPFMKLDWRSMASAESRHIELRRRHAVALPKGRIRVMLFSDAAHIAGTSRSVVATRDRSGGWHVDVVGDEALMSNSESARDPVRDLRLRYDLDADKGERLDKALADACLWASPTSIDDLHNPPFGSQTMDIVTPKGHLVLDWAADPTPQVQTILDLLSRS